MIHRRAVILSSCAFLLPACRAESQEVRPNLYACEGCEGVYERDVASLTSVARMAPLGEPGETLVLSGTVYKPNGKTPAENIVLYFYHTDAEGVYSRGRSDSEWSRRHGLLRGWVKTGADGRYEIQTIKPAPYPNLGAPAHIHPTVLEPGKPPYWIDDVVFDGEFGVTESYKSRSENRGGTGIGTLTQDSGGVWLARRDIVLERHPS